MLCYCKVNHTDGLRENVIWIVTNSVWLIFIASLYTVAMTTALSLMGQCRWILFISAKQPKWANWILLLSSSFTTINDSSIFPIAVFFLIGGNDESFQHIYDKHLPFESQTVWSHFALICPTSSTLIKIHYKRINFFGWIQLCKHKVFTLSKRQWRILAKLPQLLSS